MKKVFFLLILCGILFAEIKFDAEKAKKGLIVFAEIDGNKYHLYGCPKIQETQTKIVSLREALQERLKPCKKCDPPSWEFYKANIMIFKPIFEIEKVNISPVIPGNNIQKEKLQYIDNLINILWDINQDGFCFSLENKSPDTISIIWNECVIVDNDKKSHKTIHANVKVIDKEKEQTPTIIPSETKIDDIMVSIDNLIWQEPTREMGWGGWKTTGSGKWTTNLPFSPIELFFDEVDNSQIYEPLRQNYRAVLILQKQNQKYEYQFYFKSHEEKTTEE